MNKFLFLPEEILLKVCSKLSNPMRKKYPSQVKKVFLKICTIILIGCSVGCLTVRFEDTDTNMSSDDEIQDFFHDLQGVHIITEKYPPNLSDISDEDLVIALLPEDPNALISEAIVTMWRISNEEKRLNEDLIIEDPYDFYNTRSIIDGYIYSFDKRFGSNSINDISIKLRNNVYSLTEYHKFKPVFNPYFNSKVLHSKSIGDNSIQDPFNRMEVNLSVRKVSKGYVLYYFGEKNYEPEFLKPIILAVEKNGLSLLSPGNIKEGRYSNGVRITYRNNDKDFPHIDGNFSSEKIFNLLYSLPRMTNGSTFTISRWKTDHDEWNNYIQKKEEEARQEAERRRLAELKAEQERQKRQQRAEELQRMKDASTFELKRNYSFPLLLSIFILFKLMTKTSNRQDWYTKKLGDENTLSKSLIPLFVTLFALLLACIVALVILFIFMPSTMGELHKFKYSLDDIHKVEGLGSEAAIKTFGFTFYSIPVAIIMLVWYLVHSRQLEKRYERINTSGMTKNLIEAAKKLFGGSYQPPQVLGMEASKYVNELNSWSSNAMVHAEAVLDLGCNVGTISKKTQLYQNRNEFRDAIKSFQNRVNAYEQEIGTTFYVKNIDS